MIKGLYRHRKYTMGDKVIVMSFPGTGKTKAAKNHPDIFTEVDASDYYWGGLSLPEDMGEFPKNYVDKIEEVLEDSTIKSNIVLICNHVEVAQELRDRGIRFCTVLSTYTQTIEGIKNTKSYKSWLIKYFSDIYKDLVGTLYRQCDGSVLSTGCGNIETLFLGHTDPSVTYRHIIHYLNRRV